MSEIQRYDGRYFNVNGKYVKYEDHAAIVAQLDSQLAAIKQQFINYENADEYALDMMMEYERLQTMIMSIDAAIASKEQGK